MKLSHTILSTMLALGLLASSLFAADKVETKTAPKELKAQTNCPVMGGKIDSTAFTDIQGQRVYHCCPMCTKSLKEDPDKYFKQAAADGILFENIQTTCPVSGHELKEKKTFVDYEGRRVYFCSDNCSVEFGKDPAKYLKAIDETPTGTKSKTMEQTDHNGHGNH